MELLLENISEDELREKIRKFYKFAKKKLGITRKPKVVFVKDQKNADDFLGKTGYYDNQNESIHLFITDRHAKDVVRSFAHELVHHMQKLKGLDRDIDMSATKDPAYASHNLKLRKLEKQAFTEGNLLFRDWCDMQKTKRINTMENIIKKNKVHEKTDPVKNPDTDIDNNDEVNTGDLVLAKRRLAIAKSNGESDLVKLYTKVIKMIEKHGKVDEKSIKSASSAQAKLIRKNRSNPETIDETEHTAKENGTYGSEEAVGIYTESKKREEQPVKHPYPELFQKKERLLGEAFNKKEELVYQELLRKIVNNK